MFAEFGKFLALLKRPWRLIWANLMMGITRAYEATVSCYVGSADLTQVPSIWWVDNHGWVRERTDDAGSEVFWQT